MEPEEAPSRGRARPRRQVIAAGALGAALVAVAVTVVAGGSGGKVPQVAAAAATTTTTVPPTTTTVPPTTAPPTTVTTAPPPPPTTAPPAAAPPPPKPAPRPMAQAIVPPVPLTFPQKIDQAFGPMNGCLVIEQDGVITYERNPTTPFVPASTQKLMVAAAALARLGPDYRYETRVMANQRPGPDGRLDDAWMVGGGDPVLATPDYIGYAASRPRLNTLPLTHLTGLADALVAAGVKDIPGGLHADESRYDTQRSIPTWKPSYVSQAEVGSLGALAVNSGFAAWGPNQRVAPDPALTATERLTGLLHERGVMAAAPGPPPDGRRVAPEAAVEVASVRSAPLGEIVAAMLRASDNYIAEMVLRELDRGSGGPGSTAGGAAQVVKEMAQAGVDTTGVHLNDGSGLDTGNRSTCRALVGVLALSSRPGMDALAGGLAVAGRSGTLIKRFVGTPVEGRLAGKTGWINGAGGLAGNLDVPRQRRFALLANGSFGYGGLAALQNRVVSILAAEP